jgi:hypothetical protein
VARSLRSLALNPQSAISYPQSAIRNRQSAVANRQSAIANLLGLFVRRVLPAVAAELAELQPLAGLFLVLGGAVVPALTLAARQGNDVSHG